MKTIILHHVSYPRSYHIFPPENPDDPHKLIISNRLQPDKSAEFFFREQPELDAILLANKVQSPDEEQMQL